jgi:hypothetical protein
MRRRTTRTTTAAPAATIAAAAAIAALRFAFPKKRSGPCFFEPDFLSVALFAGVAFFATVFVAGAFFAELFFEPRFALAISASSFRL